MAKFVLYDGKWYLWNEGNMTLHNIHHGFFSINENSPDWANAVIEEADNWYDICSRHNWYPDETDVRCRDAWVSPDGRFFECMAHAVGAEWVCKQFYPPDSYPNDDNDIQSAVTGSGECEDFLVEHGWVKITTSCMYRMYIKDGHYQNMTRKQRNAIYEWAEAHGVDYPDWEE